jgi:hypothetical protein
MFFRWYSFQKLTPYSQGNNMLNACPSNIDGFLSRDTCVAAIYLNRPFWKKNVPFYPLKSMIGRPYSSQKLTQCLQGNNMEDVSGSNIDGFPSRDTCVCSTQLNRPIWNKM